jgi:hypothetical protein
MRIRVLFLTMGVAALGGLIALGQEPKPLSKTTIPPNVVPSTFRAFLVTDNRFPPVKEGEGKDAKEIPNPLNRVGKIHCLVCENGLAPVVAIFVRPEAKAFGAESGLAKLAKGLNALIPRYRAEKLAGFLIFLNLEGGKQSIKIPGAEGGTETSLTVDKEYPDETFEKRDAYSAEIRDFANAVNAPNVPFGLAANKSNSVNAWKIGEKDDITVIVYDRMRIVGQPWRFAKPADLTDEKVAEILKSVENAINERK